MFIRLVEGEVNSPCWSLFPMDSMIVERVSSILEEVRTSVIVQTRVKMLQEVRLVKLSVRGRWKLECSGARYHAKGSTELVIPKEVAIMVEAVVLVVEYIISNVV